MIGGEVFNCTAYYSTTKVRERKKTKHKKQIILGNGGLLAPSIAAFNKQLSLVLSKYTR